MALALKIKSILALFTETPKTKPDDENTSQIKTTDSVIKVNGEESITNDNDSNITTKELILNGSENSSETIVNGDPKKDLDCDISSSDSDKVVSNGISCDSNDTKVSSKSDEKEQTMVTPNVCTNKSSEGTQVTEKKKEKKTKATDSDTEKKDSPKTKSTYDKKEAGDSVTNVESSDKANGDSKIVNGEKERESSPSEDGDDKKRDAEVVFIQDMGFTVKIVSPGAEPLDIQVYNQNLHFNAFEITIVGHE